MGYVVFKLHNLFVKLSFLMMLFLFAEVAASQEVLEGSLNTGK